MNEGKILIIIGSLLMIISTIILAIGLKEEVTGEQLCVDGNGNINLEGIMCEKTTQTFFGYHPAYCLSVLILYILGGVVLWIGGTSE